LEKNYNNFVVIWQEAEKGTEGNNDENLGNDKIFSDLNNGDLSGYFGNFLQWLIICTVGEGERKTRPCQK